MLGTIGGLVLLFLAGNEFAFPVASFPLVFPLTYYLTHASLRFRHPLDPILVLLSTIPFTAILRFFAGVASTQKLRRKAPARVA